MEAVALKPWTRADYYRMAEVGLIRSDERTELIDGRIFKLTPQGSPHAACLHAVMEWLYAQLSADRALRVQSPVALDETNEPEPDLAVVTRREDSYAGEHPGAADIHLLVEIAMSTLPFDRRKAELYGRFWIPEYWVFDVSARRVLVHTDPQGDGYREVRIVGENGSLSFGSGVAKELAN